MNKSRLPTKVKIKERKKIGHKKQSRYLQDRKKKSTSQKLYLPCSCKKIHTAHTAHHYNTSKHAKERQCPRRLYLPCKKAETPHRHHHHHHQYRTKSDMSLGSIESSTVNKLVQDQNDIPTKAAGSWQVMPKDSIDLTKKRLRKIKNKNQKDDDTDDAEKCDSPTKRKKKEPKINESSPSPSSSATSGSYQNLTSNSDEEK